MMKCPAPESMRDVLIKKIYERMQHDDRIFFLSADFGSRALDPLRKKFKDRFINVGIAEQNLINIATGLALEGFIVYAYAIAPFLTMRCYEQLRVNLSILTQIKELNVNLVGVGAGLSYDLSGPTHHCFEDISIMRTLPNFMIFSPSDWVLTEKFMHFSFEKKKPKYLRLDGKPLPRIYDNSIKVDFKKGFHELKKGKDVCIVSTGYMTHKALKVAAQCLKNKLSVGVVDVFILKPVNEDLLFDCLKKYRNILTLEEGFVNSGGLGSIIADILISRRASIGLKKMGFKDRYVFEAGNRDYLHRINSLGEEDIIKSINDFKTG